MRKYHRVRGRALAWLGSVGIALSAGCSDEPGESVVDGPDGIADAASDAVVDGGPDDADPEDDASSACLAPVDAPAWMDAYLAQHVARLAGAADISPGTRLTDRATVGRRTAARSYLLGELTALGLAVTSDEYGTGANAVGELAATTGATDWIVVGAHFDSVSGSPGANDNATGVATVLAVARSLVDLPCRSHGVRFVMFDEEEVGLRGSIAYATRLQQLQVDVVAVHTVDQVGWDNDHDLRFELELPTTQLRTEYQQAAGAVGALVVATTTSGTDHTAFRERGFAAVGLTEEYVSGDTTPYYHRPGDTAATVNTAYNVMAARLVTYVVARELGAD